MSSTIIAGGLGLAALGLTARYIARNMPSVAREAEQVLKSGKLPLSVGQLLSLLYLGGVTSYYKGGFDAKMSKREASLILGVSQTASNKRIKEAHKRIMLLNHPDRGGSPYLAAKINEAKDYLESNKP